MATAIESPVGSNKSHDKPSVAELVSRAEALVPEFRAAQLETEKARRVPQAHIEQLIDADLYRILQPARFGGFEYTMADFVDVVLAVASGCGSTGWVYSNSAKYQWFIGMFPPGIQDEMWGEDRRAIAASSFNPSGVIVPDGPTAEDGWRLTGKWMFCSGVQNCSWIVLGTKVAPSKGAEPTEQGYVLVRTADLEMEDNWEVAGLEGTGSINVACEDLFVPAHGYLSLEQAQSGSPPGAAANTAPLYRIPLLSALSISLCAGVIGMSRGGYETFVETVSGRKTRGAAISNPLPMTDFTTVQLRVGEAAASIDAAACLVKRDCDEIHAAVEAGRDLTVEERARNKGNLGFATQQALHAVDRLFEAGGGNGLFRSSPMQRFWRDAHAAAMHVSLNWDAVGALYGRVEMGLPPGPAQF